MSVFPKFLVSAYNSNLRQPPADIFDSSSVRKGLRIQSVVVEVMIGDFRPDATLTQASTSHITPIHSTNTNSAPIATTHMTIVANRATCSALS